MNEEELIRDFNNFSELKQKNRFKVFDPVKQEYEE